MCTQLPYKRKALIFENSNVQDVAELRERVAHQLICDRHHTRCNIRQQRNVKQYNIRQQYNIKLECGPMPNVMVSLPNKVAPSVQRREVWLTLTT